MLSDEEVARLRGALGITPDQVGGRGEQTWRLRVDDNGQLRHADGRFAGNGRSHGTPSNYGRGCRCADCREAHRLRWQRYNATRKRKQGAA